MIHTVRTLLILSKRSQTLEKSMKKIQINKAPGQDHINGFWFKNLSCYRNILAVKFNELLHSDPNTPLATWLSTAHTSLLPKNKETHMTKTIDQYSV